jgi:hypothetical protein
MEKRPTVAAVGFALPILGGVRVVLNRGEPISRAEIEEDIGRIKYGAQGRTNPLSFRASTTGISVQSRAQKSSRNSRSPR